MAASWSEFELSTYLQILLRLILMSGSGSSTFPRRVISGAPRRRGPTKMNLTSCCVITHTIRSLCTPYITHFTPYHTPRPTTMNQIPLSMWFVLGGLLVGLFVRRIRTRDGRASNPFPPGPQGWPVIGNLLEFPKTGQAQYFRKMASFHGVFQRS